MPPGTGDIHISAAQKLKPDAAIIVGTTRELDIADIYRTENFLRQMSIPILGIVDNMTQNKADEIANKLSIPCLSNIPVYSDGELEAEFNDSIKILTNNFIEYFDKCDDKI